MAEADLLTCEGKGVLKTLSDTPPTHYTVKLQRFSMFEKHKIERYETAEFEAGGHKWKLILYPYGNKSKIVNDHISVYLSAVESSLPNLLSEVHAVFKVFLRDENNDNYYTLQVANAKRFHKMKLEWGFDHFMLLNTFKDPSNGYLVDDTCVFGAEVYVSNKNICKGEQWVMMNYVDSYKHIWKIDDFSAIATKEVHDSMNFNSGDQEWKLKLYPKGCGTGSGSHISIFLNLDNYASLPNASRIRAEFTIRIIDQVHGKNHSKKATSWHDKSSASWGWQKFISLTDFNASSKGFLVKDSCIFEAEVTVHGVATAL